MLSSIHPQRRRSRSLWSDLPIPRPQLAHEAKGVLVVALSKRRYDNAASSWEALDSVCEHRNEVLG